MKKLIWLLCLSIVFSFALSGLVFAQETTVNVTVTNSVPLEQTAQTGRVDWSQGIVEAVGTGVPPQNAVSAAQGKLLARRAAIVDAYRNLSETIQGVQVTSETTMENFMIGSDVVKTKVEGIIKGAHVIRESAQPDGSYQVVMSVNLYGANSVASVALPAVKPAVIQEFPAPSIEFKATVRPSSESTIQPDSMVTGVIIDARGLGLEPTFSPVIYDQTERSVYGSAYIDADFAISQGMVDYMQSPEAIQGAENGQGRAGARPMIIKAVALKDHNYNVVISKTDADRILAANQRSGFLKNCAVVFER